MTVEFLPEARTEWVETISYYNEQRSDLGHEFALEVDRTLERILQFPHAWVLIGERTRRALVDRFPYGILYYIHGEATVVSELNIVASGPQPTDGTTPDARIQEQPRLYQDRLVEGSRGRSRRARRQPGPGRIRQ